MTIVMSEQVDTESCDVLRGGDGPVYFLLGGQLYVVHEVLGRWIEADPGAARPVFEHEGNRSGGAGAGPTVPEPRAPEPDRPSAADSPRTDPQQRQQPYQYRPAESWPQDESQLAEPRSQRQEYPSRSAESRPDDESPLAEPPMVEHWLVTASVGRFGRPAVFRLQRRPAPPAKGPDTWTVRAERR